MTEAQLDAAFAKGYEDLKEGRTIPAGQAFVELRRNSGCDTAAPGTHMTHLPACYGGLRDAMS